MAMLLKTTKTDKHWHLIFFDQDGKVLESSMDNEHKHPLQIVLDPITRQPNISVGEAEGHTHDIEPVNNPLPEKPTHKSDSEVVASDLELFKTAVNYEADSRKNALEAHRFYKGEQWDKGVKQDLEAKKRATQVYNYVQSKIDVLSGLARQNRVDPKAFPVEGSDDGVADIATATLMRVAKQNNLASQEIRVFEDEAIGGRGLFHIGMTRKNNPLGDVLIERFPWADGYFGPHNELDASDATHAHKAKWISLGEAKARYPKHADKLEEMIGISDNAGHGERVELIQDKGSRASSVERYNTDPEIFDIEHKKVRIIEHEIKEFRTAFVVTTPDGGFSEEVSESEHTKAATISALVPMEFDRERIRVSITVGTQLLKNHYPDRPYDGFSLIPVYAYKYDDGSFAGKVESMKGPQREINKRGSQSIDIVNRMLGRGWFYDPETFEDPKEADKFKAAAGGSGWLQKVADTQRPPVPAELPPFPNELFNLHSLNLSIMEGVSNINPGMSGMGKTGYESGTTLRTMQKSGLVGNEKIFDNFILSKQMLFRKVFKMIQRYYTPERIARITLSEASDPTRVEDLQVGGQPISPQRDPQADAEAFQNIIRMLQTKDLADYDIQIGEQAFSATNKEAQFMQWMEAASHGMQVPPQLLIDLSSLPNKGKYAREMMAIQQQNMQMEQMKYQAEMEKAGRVPPSGQA